MNQYLRRKIWTLNRSGKFRGYLRTVSGYPVTLTDCMTGQPVSLAVDGDAVQDGTPTPDNPVDVQLCGDRTVNLFDETLVEGKIGTQNADLGFIEDGKTYSVTCVGNGNGIMIVRGLTSENDGAGTEISAFRNVKGQVIRTFTADLTTYVKYVIRYYYSEKNDIHNIMIIKGTYTAETMPAYEPHGYKVPLTIECGNLYTGELLYKPASVSVEQIPSGYRFFYEIGIYNFIHVRYKCHNVKPYTAYTAQIKVKVNSFSEDTKFVFRAFENKNVADYLKTLKEYTTTYSKLGIGEIKDITIKFNTKECTDIYLQTNFNWLESSKFDVEITDIKLTEDGITPQTFNIYTPQQLAKVGDTADTVVLDFDNKRAYINSMFIKTIYDGSENWTQTKSNAGEDKYVCVSPKISDALSSQNTYQNATAISNIFKLGPYAGASSGIECFIIYNKSIQIYHHGEPVDEFKQFLSELANSNNQLTVLCRRESSYVTDITALQDWDAMPSLWNGTAAITADTVIAPSAITAKYYASKPEEVN